MNLAFDDGDNPAAQEAARLLVTNSAAPGLRFRRLAGFAVPAPRYAGVVLDPDAEAGEVQRLRAAKIRVAVLDEVLATPETAPQFGGGDATWRVVITDVAVENQHLISMQAQEILPGGATGRETSTCTLARRRMPFHLGLFDGHVLFFSDRIEVVTLKQFKSLSFWIFNSEDPGFIDETSNPPTLVTFGDGGCKIYRATRIIPRITPHSLPSYSISYDFACDMNPRVKLYGEYVRPYRFADARGRLWLALLAGNCRVCAADFTPLHVFTTRIGVNFEACLDEGLVVSVDGAFFLVDIPDPAFPEE